MAKFEDSLEKTRALRKECSKDLLPLFDHVVKLALDSHSHGYFKRAGRELLHARRLATRFPNRSKDRRFGKRRSF